MALCLTLLFPVSAFATEAVGVKEPTLVYQAKQITDPNQLLMRAKLGIDERSDAVRQATSIQAKTNVNSRTGLTAMDNSVQNAYVTTQLLGREVLDDGSVVEHYATAAITRSALTATNSETENSVIVTAMINYSTRQQEAIVQARLDKTQHRTVYPTAVTTSNMELTNKVDNGLEILYSNSRNIASPSNNTWYTLSSPTSQYFDLSKKFQGTTTVTASNGASPYVMCEVNLHTALS